MDILCDGCKHYGLSEVPIDPFNDPDGSQHGFEERRLCLAGDDDQCPLVVEMEQQREPVKPCPTCGRDIDGYADCPHCLEVEILATTDAARQRQQIRDILAAS